jgi:hypothetical protein
VAAAGGWEDDARVAGWGGGGLSAAEDTGVRRAVARLAAVRVIDYVARPVA